MQKVVGVLAAVMVSVAIGIDETVAIAMFLGWFCVAVGIGVDALNAIERNTRKGES